MKVSVVVNAHAGTSFQEFCGAADSILAQDYDDFEMITVIADAPKIYEQLTDQYGDHDRTRFVWLEEDTGLSVARNAGAEASNADIVVFTDDDVVAEPDWLTELVAIYERYEATGVGGHVVPIWPDKKPWNFPNEFFWLVGVMHDNFVEKQKPQPVRNTFGCNISFDREAFLDAGGFREDLGKNQKYPLQGEEAELCERLDGKFWYTPDAIVHHRVNVDQLSVRYLFRRAFWQGYSKAALADDMSGESSFFRHLCAESIPRRLANPSKGHLGEIAMILSLTGLVGIGFLYGKFSAKR